MQNTVNVLYYSNNSNSSNTLFNMISQNNVNINDLLYLKLINVDCDVIKLKLVKSKKLKVEKVPCLLSLDASGNIKQYYDKELFDLFRNIIKIEKDKIEEKDICNNLNNEIQTITNEFQKCADQSSNLINTIKQYEAYMTESDAEKKTLVEENTHLKLELESLKEEHLERAANYKKQVQFTKQGESPAANESTIDTSELNELNPTGGSIRTDSLNYENNIDFGAPQEINRDVSHKLEPKNIMQQAEQIQKDRGE